MEQPTRRAWAAMLGGVLGVSVCGRAVWGDPPLRVHPATELLQGPERRDLETF